MGSFSPDNPSRFDSGKNTATAASKNNSGFLFIVLSESLVSLSFSKV